jgi:ornithine carbamoyltransferase
MKKKDLLSLKDLSRRDIEEILSLARDLKRKWKKGLLNRVLAGKTLALVFEKPSLRTRVSFETGIFQMGGHAVFLSPDEVQLGVRETSADCARNLSRWVDLIVVRTFSQETVEAMALAATVPVINGLTDLLHPCQVLADCFTLLEQKKKLDELKIAFVGDGNNMVNSWMEAAERFSFRFFFACPRGYEPDAEITRRVRDNGGKVVITYEVEEAVRGADVVYTDVWASMGREAEFESRRKIFHDYQVNRAVVALARRDAVVMHCLPAHRGEEITDEVLDGAQSIVLDQAENRLHVQKAIMVWLLKGSKRSTGKGLKKS